MFEAFVVHSQFEVFKLLIFKLIPQ